MTGKKIHVSSIAIPRHNTFTFQLAIPKASAMSLNLLSVLSRLADRQASLFIYDRNSLKESAASARESSLDHLLFALLDAQDSIFDSVFRNELEDANGLLLYIIDWSALPVSCVQFLGVRPMRFTRSIACCSIAACHL